MAYIDLTIQVWMAELCHLPQYEYGPLVPKPGYEAKPRCWEPVICTHTGAGDTVLEKHT